MSRPAMESCPAMESPTATQSHYAVWTHPALHRHPAKQSLRSIHPTESYQPMQSWRPKWWVNWRDIAIEERKTLIGNERKQEKKWLVNCPDVLSTNGRSKGEGKGKEEEGKEKGKLEVILWQKQKKSQTPQLKIEPGTPANAADALPLSHWDKRHHQPVYFEFFPLCRHFTVQTFLLRVVSATP